MTDEERKQFINEYCRNVGNIKIKCDDCKFEPECADYGWLGCKKFTPAPSTPMTNEEWIKSANTEQLADVLMKIFATRTFCHLCPEGGVCDIGYECKYHGGNTKDFVEWLKQPHTIKEIHE